MSVSFALDGSATISRQVRHLLPTTSSQRDIREYYDIDRCLDFIGSDASFRKVYPTSDITCTSREDIVSVDSSAVS